MRPLYIELREDIYTLVVLVVIMKIMLLPDCSVCVFEQSLTPLRGLVTNGGRRAGFPRNRRPVLSFFHNINVFMTLSMCGEWIVCVFYFHSKLVHQSSRS